MHFHEIAFKKCLTSERSAYFKDHSLASVVNQYIDLLVTQSLFSESIALSEEIMDICCNIEVNSLIKHPLAFKFSVITLPSIQESLTRHSIKYTRVLEALNFIEQRRNSLMVKSSVNFRITVDKLQELEEMRKKQEKEKYRLEIVIDKLNDEISLEKERVKNSWMLFGKIIAILTARDSVIGEHKSLEIKNVIIEEPGMFVVNSIKVLRSLQQALNLDSSPDLALTTRFRERMTDVLKKISTIFNIDVPDWVSDSIGDTFLADTELIRSLQAASISQETVGLISKGHYPSTTPI